MRTRNEILPEVKSAQPTEYEDVRTGGTNAHHVVTQFVGNSSKPICYSYELEYLASTVASSFVALVLKYLSRW
jgi:hypothetical protein